ncbi:ATP-binding protein [Streptomyces sp. OV198]|uniref:ATP-binding protein n=1 Tax=Streptomyces sp. OV198 TaxID=1882787 RepID=UPI0027B887B9|nr:ATP-binding protein [Streptomyces sp. OV198]
MTRTEDLLHDRPDIRNARRQMRDRLQTTGIPNSVIDDAVLILSELLTNACLHGRPLVGARQGAGHVRIHWQTDCRGRLRIEVTDGGGCGLPVVAAPSTHAQGGRALHMVAALANDWGVRDDRGERGERVTVWAVPSCEHGPDSE